MSRSNFRLEGRWWLLLLPLSAAILAAAAFLGWEVYMSLQRARQVGTQATLQDISHAVGELEVQDSPLDHAQLRSAILQVQDGLDGWRNEILSDLCPTPSGYDYLLISRGADGKLDVDRTADYCEVQKRISVAGEFRRDIVFRDGRPLQSGGK